MPQEDTIKVAVLEKTIYLKPIGCATQQNCLGLPDFLSVMFRVGCTRVCVDLRECEAMDSTFLGVLAYAATCLPGQNGETVAVLQPNERNLQDIHTVGLEPLVTLCDDSCTPPDQVELREVDFVHFPDTEQERIERIKHLHELLVDLNEENRERFAPFLRMLGEEMESS